MSKLREMKVVQSVAGKGKGKYVFVKQLVDENKEPGSPDSRAGARSL